jgi:hypothetical protein
LSVAERSTTRRTTAPGFRDTTRSLEPARVSAMRLSGPTEPASWIALAAGGLGAGGGCVGGGAPPTVKLPNIVVWCGSHWKWWVPSVKVTVHVTVPVVSTSVAWSTPGPVRWKLCSGDRSCTWIV